MSTGFTFGTKPATPAFGQTGFGAPTTGSITFGTPTVQNPAPFGATTQPTAGFGSNTFGMPAFGTPTATTQSTGLTFGTPSTTGFAFGTTPTSSAPNTGLTFGTPSTLATGTAPNFGFGGAVPPSTGLAFGTPATSAPTGFAFGTPTSTVLAFATPATTTTKPMSLFGLSTPIAQTAPTLGQPQPTTNAGLFVPGSFNFAGPTTTTSAPSFNLNFGAPTTTTTASLFNLTAPSSTTAGTGLNFGLGTTTAPTGLSFNLSTTTTALTIPKPTTITTTSAQSVGLGGIVQSTPKSELSTPGKPEVVPHDQQLPNELQQTVENFKNFVKQQKGFSSDVARISVKEFKKVTSEIDQVGTFLNEAEKQLQINRALAEKLKLDTAKGLQNIEMAQRTMDTPPGLQYDNVMPMAFFRELIDNFEKELQNLKLQIDYTDKYIRNLDQPLPLSSQDLSVGMRRLHETFVALAGRLQTVHSQVESQKEQYLNFRKYMLNDDTNIFEKPKNQTSDILNITFTAFDYKPPTVASGPSPFNALSHPSVIQAAIQNQQTPSNVTATGNTGFGVPQPTNTGASSLFGNTSSFGQAPSSTLQFNSSSNSNFQLQKPPTGNKRGKQITY